MCQWVPAGLLVCNMRASVLAQQAVRRLDRQASSATHQILPDGCGLQVQLGVHVDCSLLCGLDLQRVDMEVMRHCTPRPPIYVSMISRTASGVAIMGAAGSSGAAATASACKSSTTGQGKKR